MLFSMQKSYEHYFNNEDLLEFLKFHKQKFSQYFDYESVGKSSLGEDIWLITLTDKEVARADQKPAFWIEANIHASEVTGTQGALYLCERLLESIEKENGKLKIANQDFSISTILQKITYYILPRFTPDGARTFFQQKNSSRSTPLERPFHYSDSTFKRKDLDGDGEITLMRWQDPAGPFKELDGCGTSRSGIFCKVSSPAVQREWERRVDHAADVCDYTDSGDYSIVTDIQQTRMMLYNTVIHETNCQWMLECLENYKYEFNTRLQMWTQQPMHDKYSHMMDALRYAVQAVKELDFFNGKFFDRGGQRTSSISYEEDWSSVWA
jgi:hypothetical protein